MVNLEWFYTLNLRGKSPPFKGGNPEFDSREMKFMALSSNGLGGQPLTLIIRVRIPAESPEVELPT